MSYKRCDIVWVKFPFTDLTSVKLRPALIISNEAVNKTGDYVLMQVTTNLRKDFFSLLIADKDFDGKSLLKQSELRLHKIFIIHETLIESKITSIKLDFMKSIIEKLILLLK